MNKRDTFRGYVVTFTDRAVLFWDHYWHKPEFFPKSQTTVEFDPNTDETVMKASNWICVQKNIREGQEVTDDAGD